jgi:hypothetical protein
VFLNLKEMKLKGDYKGVKREMKVAIDDMYRRNISDIGIRGMVWMIWKEKGN